MRRIKQNSVSTPYSSAVISGDTIYVSGQLGIEKDGTTGDLARQTEIAIASLDEILKAAGSKLSKVVKTTCFLAEGADPAVFNEVYMRSFPEKPARSLVWVSSLPKGSLVEIEAIAEKTKE